MLKTIQRIWLILTLMLGALVAQPAAADTSQIALARRLLLNNKVSILVPIDFNPLPDELVRVKYRSASPPSVVLGNDSGTVNLAMDLRQVTVGPTDIPQVHEQLKQGFRNLYPSAVWNKTELRKINGTEFAILDLFTPALDGEIRNVMAVTSLDNRLLVITFNCTKTLDSTWRKTAVKMLESIKLYNSSPPNNPVER